MAEMESLATTGNSLSQSTVAPSNESSGSSPAAQPQETPKDKTFTQSDIDRIVGRSREEFREKYYNQGRQDAISELKTQSNQTSMGGIQQPTQQDIEKMVEDKIRERSQAETANHIAQDFIGKMQTGKEKYSDFDETVAQLNLPAHPHLIYWANSLDNTVDVIYDVAKNPEKFASILMLSQTAPELARRKMTELSNSIKKNEEAKKESHVNEPLSQIKPSTVGTDNGSMTVRDLRKQPWLRG